MAQSNAYDAVIVGAGIVGASTAWHLARHGMSVAVVDATGPAAAASGASDGAVSVASKKPGIMARLATASLLYTRVLGGDGGVLAGNFAARPSYFLATGEAEDAALDQLVAKLASLGDAVAVTGDGPASSGPAGIGPLVTRIVSLTGEGHMLAYDAVAAYLRLSGASCHWPFPVDRLEADSAGVTIHAGKEHLRAARVVVAMGVSSAQLLPGLPIVPRAGQLFVTDRAPPPGLPGALTAASYLLAKTVSHENPGKPPVVIDPLATGQVLIGSSRENHGDASRVDFATMFSLVERAADFWPALRQRSIVRAFAGIRAAVTDGLPILGAIPGENRIFAATGFEGDGICLSALMGREAAAMVAGASPTAGLERDLDALSPCRFAAQRVAAS